MDLDYEIQDRGEPIVLLDSGGADLRDWQFIALQLATHYQVITFDSQGAGNRPHCSNPLTLLKYLRRLLDRLNLECVALVGHSIGGQIATDFALAYPKRVSKLVLVAPGLSGHKFSQTLEQWFEQIRAAVPNVEKMTQLAHPVHSVLMSSPQHCDNKALFRAIAGVENL